MLCYQIEKYHDSAGLEETPVSGEHRVIVVYEMSLPYSVDLRVPVTVSM